MEDVCTLGLMASCSNSFLVTRLMLMHDRTCVFPIVSNGSTITQLVECQSHDQDVAYLNPTHHRVVSSFCWLNQSDCILIFFSCWLKTDNYFILSFVIPVAVVVLVSIISVHVNIVMISNYSISVHVNIVMISNYSISVHVNIVMIWNYSKTCVKPPLKNRQNKELNDKW